ncbi:uncharacterized protein LOC130657222 isoform X1 [Hydractinia symbiolongicarpus]|uniref:uncharacterized protein LOC130657222 isoform X1 n=1 Tax=Hydractinia symbiolongicarpus TaxID=13093 RepID=UPI00254B9C25|nr:uncharacterized protein LOC130657222 isoform X1 [Hydractinia symbiolongicarpus]
MLLSSTMKHLRLCSYKPYFLSKLTKCNITVCSKQKTSERQRSTVKVNNGEGLHHSSHGYIESITKSHVAVALQDLEDSLLRRYFKKYTKYQIRFIYVTLAILGVGGLTLYVFREPIKNNLSGEMADVASRSLGDESVVVKANEMSKQVLKDIINDPNSSVIVSNFIVSILKTKTVQESVIYLLKDVINNEDIQKELSALVQNTLQDILKHQETRLLLLNYITLLLSDDQTKLACQQLLKTLADDDYSKHILAQFFKDVLSSDTVKNQAVELSKDVTQSIVNDENIQKETGTALWNAGMYSVTPKWLS